MAAAGGNVTLHPVGVLCNRLMILALTTLFPRF